MLPWGLRLATRIQPKFGSVTRAGTTQAPWLPSGAWVLADRLHKAIAKICCGDGVFMIDKMLCSTDPPRDSIELQERPRRDSTASMHCESLLAVR